MRLGLVQFPHVRGERTANLIRTLAAIDRAAAADPAPDLLVLPGRCDGGGTAEASLERIDGPPFVAPVFQPVKTNAVARLSGSAAADRADATDKSPAAPRLPTDSVNSSGWTTAELLAQSFSESLAARAREWGIFIAAGLHRARHGGVAEGAALFDPDGDVVLECWADPSNDSAGSDPTTTWAETSLGRLALRYGMRTDAACDSASPGSDTTLMIAWLEVIASTGARSLTDQQATQRCRALAQRAATVVCAVFPPTDGSVVESAVGMTVVCKPDDESIAIAGRDVDEMTIVELP